MPHVHATPPLSTHDTTRIDDLRIGAVRPLITPALLQEWLPTPPAAQALVESSRAALSRVLHGEQRVAYHAPVVVGDTLTFQSRVTSVNDKKGGAMTMVVVETEITNQHGAHVADSARTIVVRN